jgi:hypothetical protein
VTPDAPPVASLCETYCQTITTNCTGANAQYEDMADCMSYCDGASWPDGEVGAQEGNSLGCRIYHGGAPAMSQPALHCSHAGPTGDGVCGAVDFRTDAANTYTRVDGMGMPAVATALVPSASKDAYNDASPDSNAYAGDFVATIEGLHGALDDDLAGLNLAACSQAQGANPSCVTQEYAPGATVASLVLPEDSLAVNPAVAAGFPNGRTLTDRVIDVTLAVLLLDLDGGTCGTGTCTAGTLAAIPLNPGANDVAFSMTFPYLAPPHQP